MSAVWKAVELASPEKLVDRSVNQLSERYPDMSASRTLSRGQALVIAALGITVAAGLVTAALPVLIALNALGTALYLVVFVHGVVWFRGMVRNPALAGTRDEEALAVPVDQLPTYTVMVAAYQEANVIGECIRALEALDYPRDRLEVRLLLEADDRATIEAARATPHGLDLQIIEVPVSMPRTKPKACNYGLQLTGGEIVTIYDAEDRPDPLQLRRAALAFRRLGPEIACLQAKLHYHNLGDNFITRSFGVEYLSWFAFMLPALARAGGPVPLGGTSMHVRREALERVGAWDPHNVTEDADLGVRLHRLGYRTEVLDSVTLEEANSDFVNWVKQRSRWYKGYLQTWLVHIRHPVRLWRELGTRAFVAFNVVVGGTPILAALNPVFWLLAVLWLVARPQILQMLFPAWLYYPAMACMVGGNFLAVYRTVIGVRAAGRLDLLGAALCSPVYWTMMSIAAIRAIAELTVKPSHWEKTVHGLGGAAREAAQHA